MNIREVEDLTGLVRANIRYYEDEGFFTPQRERNGYRNYSDEDIEVLKRIKLLRMLEIPIEEIRKVQSDEVLMRTVLEKSIRRAEERKRELTDAQQICRKMNEDRVTWNTLEADRYLKQFGKIEEEKVQKSFSIHDYPVYEPHNIRRWAARVVDMQLYGVIIYLVYYLLLTPGVVLKAPNSFVIQCFAFGLTALFEPLFLHYLGTTPGKWILGIRVHHMVGRNLTLEEGRRRIGSVLLWGYGLGLPIFSLVRLIKSAVDNSAAKGLPWENGGEYELTAAKIKNWKQGVLRIGACILMLIVTIGVQALLQMDAQYPINRGSLTKAELAENINDYMEATGIYANRKLDENLNWYKDKTAGTVIIVGGVEELPTLNVEEVEENITAVSFTQTITQDGMIFSYDSFIQTLLLAYGGAQPTVNLWNDRLHQLGSMTSETMDGGFCGEVAGLDIDYQIKNEGYKMLGSNCFFGEEGEKHELIITFTMRLSK